MHVFSRVINDGEPLMSDPRTVYRDHGGGPLLELFEVEETAIGKRPGAHLGSCHVRTLLQHRELAAHHGVRIGQLQLEPTAATQLIDQLSARYASYSANAVDLAKKPALKSRTFKAPEQKSALGKVQELVAKMVGDFGDVTSAGLHVSGPRL
jgi:hypothetical protein